MSLVSNILKTLLPLALFWVGLAIFLPPSMGAAKYKVSPKDVSFRAVDSTGFTYRFNSKPAQGTLKTQYSSRQKTERRFYTSFKPSLALDAQNVVYIPSAGGNIRILLNGAIFETGESQAFFAPGWGEHRLVATLPRRLLLPGKNRLDIYIAGDDPYRSGLRAIYIGPRETIEKVARAQSVWKINLPIFVMSLGVLISVIALLGLTIGTRKLRYILYGLLTCVLIFQSSLSFLTDITPLMEQRFTLAYAIPIVILVLLTAIVLHERKSYKIVNTLGYPIGYLILAASGPALGLWYMLAPMYLGGQLAMATLALTSVLPLLAITVGKQFFADVKERQSKIQRLDQKVSEQSVIIDQKTRDLVKEMRGRALLEERARFTRDIHDGIGGQLLSLLLRVRTGEVDGAQVADELQAGLHDLRLVVDSLDNIGEDLAAALTTFKLRIEPQMRAAKIALIWNQTEPLSAQIETQGGTLHLYRFMQEAFTNAVRHSGANEVCVDIDAHSLPGILRIDISDNGKGFHTDDTKIAGKGLKNLKTRAQDLGAKMALVSMPNNGTQISLNIPMSNAQAIPEPSA